MEYQTKKTQILSTVEFSNLLSFSLVENKLQRNFRSIVQALMLNQAKTEGLNQEHNRFKDQHSQQISKINAKLQQMSQQWQNLKNNEKNNEITVPSNGHFNSVNELKRLSDKNLLQKKQSAFQQDKSQNEQLNDWRRQWDADKNSLLKQIANLKAKVQSVGNLQGQLKDFKIDIRLLKEEIATNLKNSNLRSSKTMTKRQSILNMVANKNSEKNIQKSKNQLRQPSKHSIKSYLQDQNKQNNPNRLSQENLDINQNQVNQNLQKQLNSVYIELNTLKISFEELRDMLSDSKKQLYKSNSLLSQVKDDLSRQVKTRKGQNQELEKTIKEIKMQMLNLSPCQNSLNNQAQEKGLRQSSKTNKTQKRDQDDGNTNYKNQLNDKISRMQAIIQNLITESEFNRFKNETNDQLEKLSLKLQNTDSNLDNLQKKMEDLILENQMRTNQQLSELKNNVSVVEQSLKNQGSQNQRKHNMYLAKIQQLKKSLQNLRQDMEFYQSMMAENKAEKKPQQNRNQTTQNSSQNKEGSNLDQKAMQGLKKYFSGKMHDLRTNLLGLIRDLEKKMNTKTSGQNDVVKIWDKLNEMYLFLNKKADQDDTKKTFLYLQKKINRLNGVLLKNEDNTQDARIARTNNWHCLSCDKNLQAYQGKIGKHVVWDSMPLKGINKSVINQQDVKKKGLPQLKK